MKPASISRLANSPLGVDTINITLPALDIDLLSRDFDVVPGAQLWNPSNFRGDDVSFQEADQSRERERYKGAFRLGRDALLKLDCSENLRFGGAVDGENDDTVYWVEIKLELGRLLDPNGWRTCRIADAVAQIFALVVWLGRQGCFLRDCDHVKPENLFLVPTPGSDEHGNQRAQVGGLCEDWDCLNETVSWSRLDLALDFLNIIDNKIWFEVVARYPQPKLVDKCVRPTYVFVTAGTEGRTLRIYDKRAQLARRRGRPKESKPSGPCTRVEVQLRGKILRTKGVKRICDLDNPGIVNIYLDVFRWAGLDRWVGGYPDLRPQPHSEMSATVARRLITWLIGQLDVNEEVHNSASDKKYRRLAERYGRVPGYEPHADLGRLRYLDVTTAQEKPVGLAWCRAHDRELWKFPGSPMWRRRPVKGDAARMNRRAER